MKRIFKTIFALLLVGVFAVNGQNAQAAKYGRGPKVTVPKNMRGTWYSYDSGNDRGGKPDKVTFTTHTVTNSHLKHLTLYKKLSRENPGFKYDAVSAKDKAKNKKILQATKKWGQAYWQNVTGNEYYRGGNCFFVDKWVSEYDEYWAYYRIIPIKVNGKKTNVLFYSCLYTWANYYPTKAMAKKFQKNTSGKTVRFS